MYAQSEIDATPTQAGKTKRFTNITVSYTRYRWWLIRYSNNWIECSFPIEHDGLPDGDDIAGNCTEDVYDEWMTSEPCSLAKVRFIQPMSRVLPAPGQLEFRRTAD